MAVAALMHCCWDHFSTQSEAADRKADGAEAALAVVVSVAEAAVEDLVGLEVAAVLAVAAPVAVGKAILKLSRCLLKVWYYRQPIR